MCMLTVFPMPGLLDDAMIERLVNGAVLNPDGSGWAVVQGNHVEIGKSLKGDEAIQSFVKAYARATGPALFHSRWATHGSKSIPNVHPFFVKGYRNTILAHNGIMDKDAWPGEGDDRSDTRIFAEEILPRRFRRLDSGKVRDHLDAWLAGNKVAVITTNAAFQRQLYLFGQEYGNWVDGAWFSNHDHEGYSHRFASLANDYETDSCLLCHGKSVSSWGYCSLCGTCQDCMEPQKSCLCYTGDGAHSYTVTAKKDEAAKEESGTGWPEHYMIGGKTPQTTRSNIVPISQAAINASLDAAKAAQVTSDEPDITKGRMPVVFQNGERRELNEQEWQAVLALASLPGERDDDVDYH